MIAVFVNQLALESVLPLPSGVVIGIPITSMDGRVAICHDFDGDDVSALQDAGAEMMENLPGDWEFMEG